MVYPNLTSVKHKNNLYAIILIGMKVKPPRIDDLVYTLDGSGYKEAIEKAYSYASETLLHVLMQDYDLLGRLK